jgi:preprotein translocase subunit SecD
MTKELRLKFMLILAITLLFVTCLMPTCLGKKEVLKDTGDEVLSEQAKTERAAKVAAIEKNAALLPTWWWSEKLNLGLDLQGGMHLVYTVKIEVALKAEIEHMKETTTSLLKEKNIAIAKIEDYGKLGFRIHIASLKDMPEAEKAVKRYYNPQEYELTIHAGTSISIEIKDRLKTYLSERALEQVRKNLAKRVDELGVREPTIITRGVDRIIVELPGVMDPLQAESILKNPGVLHFKLVKDSAPTKEELMQKLNNQIPPEYDLYFQKDPMDKTLVSHVYLLKKTPDIDGTKLTDARLSWDENNQPAVSFTFNPQGAQEFGNLTQNSIGKQLAIVLNNQVESAPVIRSRIESRGQITGNFTQQEAEGLSVVLRSGALPVPIETDEQRTVGAALGADSIRAGKISTLLGLVAVILFMAWYYGIGGLVADIALLLNVLFILGCMAAVGATLTMPGIAGILLTIGMAVDANVLIFERIREEQRLGKTGRSVLSAGYAKAFSAIFDSNLTTILTGLVLYQYGTGPIKGFAVTLILGLLTSMFTALYVTKAIFEYMMNKNWLKTFSMREAIKSGTKIDFVGKQWRFAMVSIILVAASAVVIMTKPIVYGIDFAGGAELLVKFDQPTSANTVRKAVDTLKFGESIIQTFGDPKSNEYIIKMEGSADQLQNINNVVGQALQNAIGKDKFDPAKGILRVDVVGPKAGSELKGNAIVSVIMSWVLILLYIAFRFEFKYSPGAVVALIHDVTITFGVLVLCSRQYTLQVLAALLTIIGYSINDTIIVYDRIREVRRSNRSMSLAEVINLSVNQTLSRTIMTSFVTFLAVLALLLFGGQATFDFALAMSIGIVVGTYSSVFIASPILLMIDRYTEKRAARKVKAPRKK